MTTHLTARASARSPCRRRVAWALAAACVIGAPFGAAAAGTQRVDLGLRSAGQTCDGKHTYGYVVTWQGGPEASYYVNSGNGCKAEGSVCGVGAAYCLARCSKAGACRVAFRGCTIGRGTPWSRVTATDRSVSAQITALPPGKCG